MVNCTQSPAGAISRVRPGGQQQAAPARAGSQAKPSGQKKRRRQDSPSQPASVGSANLVDEARSAVQQPVPLATGQVSTVAQPRLGPSRNHPWTNWGLTFKLIGKLEGESLREAAARQQPGRNLREQLRASKISNEEAWSTDAFWWAFFMPVSKLHFYAPFLAEDLTLVDPPSTPGATNMDQPGAGIQEQSQPQPQAPTKPSALAASKAGKDVSQGAPTHVSGQEYATLEAAHFYLPNVRLDELERRQKHKVAWAKLEAFRLQYWMT